MSILSTFFPSLCRQPKVGDVYIHVADERNPFYPPNLNTIIEVRGKHVKYENSSYKGRPEMQSSMSIAELLCFYELYEPQS